jgi:hypothetical protein
MCPVIDNPTSCKIHAVIHLLHAVLYEIITVLHKMGSENDHDAHKTQRMASALTFLE